MKRSLALEIDYYINNKKFIQELNQPYISEVKSQKLDIEWPQKNQNMLKG